MSFPKTRLLIAAVVMVLGAVACDTAPEDVDVTTPVVGDTTTTPLVGDTTTTTLIDTTTTTGG